MICMTAEEGGERGVPRDLDCNHLTQQTNLIMQSIARDLAMSIVERMQTVPPDARLLIGISGIPASGKSTLAARTVDFTNELLAKGGQADIEAVLVGLDGWHLTRAQLDAFPDPKLAHDRRGAHWTFDGRAYLDFVHALRRPPSDSEPILAPSFDHALKDPAPGAVTIHARHRIVVIEGLYTFLSVEPWAEAGRALDERWWVQVDLEEARTRLVKRHVVSGVAPDWETAEWRARENDMPNGEFIVANLLPPTRTIASVEDPELTDAV